MRTSLKHLEYLNTTYNRLHAEYEKAFWDFRNGKGISGEKMNKAEAARDAFRSNKKLKLETEKLLKTTKGADKKKLKIWNDFLALFQIPEEAIPIRKKIAEIEEKILKIFGTRREGYIDPTTLNFIEASRIKMRTTMLTSPDEALRKACFEGVEKLALDALPLYVEVIKYRNEYAQILGYEDFYAYKARLDEGMTKKELFSIFDKIYEKTKYAFQNIRDLEKEKPGLRKPWNFGYMMTGDFVKEEDQYFKFENVIDLWARSFSALGIDYKGGTLVLDLLDRKGKWDNGFCHYPGLVHYDKRGKFVPGEARFTSTAIPAQLGSGIDGIHTVFHEAGHAADRLNSLQSEVCINTEYPPGTVSWAETHSMFMDTISSNIEWKVRYAKNEKGECYPFELFEKKMKAVHPLLPLDMMNICFVVDYERRIYECKDLDEEKVKQIARESFRKYFDRSEDSLMALNIPHIYSWESSAYYHGYGLAELGVSQWREYFFKKYGYIVDNPKVGKEMAKVWKYASLYKANELVKMATGKYLNADAYIRDITRSLPDIMKNAKAKIKRLEKIPVYTKEPQLNAKISIVHGVKKIADSSRGFKNLDAKFRKWIRGLK